MAQTDTTTINVRVDENVKRNVEVLFDEMGMNISTAVNMFFKKCLMENALPFQPRAKAGISLKEALRESQEQAVLNKTSNMTLSEINKVIKKCRQDK